MSHGHIGGEPIERRYTCTIAHYACDIYASDEEVAAHEAACQWWAWVAVTREPVSVRVDGPYGTVTMEVRP